MTNRKIEYWVIPPEADAEFVANMEEVLETYAKPYDPTCPVLCMDEQPVQLVKETRKPIAATAKHPRRVDYEYERAGTAEYFHVHANPSRDGGWQRRGSRRRKWIGRWKWRGCSTVVTSGCEKVILVCDNLNTHTKGAFYEAFPPDQARQYVRRLEFRHTPKHGSWLNIAENELSSMTRQCIGGRRIGDLKTLREQIRSVVKRCQQDSAPRRLANENRRRPLQTEVSLSQDQAVTKH